MSSHRHHILFPTHKCDASCTLFVHKLPSCRVAISRVQHHHLLCQADGTTHLAVDARIKAWWTVCNSALHTRLCAQDCAQKMPFVLHRWCCSMSTLGALLAAGGKNGHAAVFGIRQALVSCGCCQHSLLAPLLSDNSTVLQPGLSVPVPLCMKACWLHSLVSS